MSNGYESFLTEADIGIIESIKNTNLGETEKESVINDIKAQAYRESQRSLDHLKPKESFDVRTLTTRKPDGWDEAKVRVKAQLETSRLNAPIEGTRNEAFYAAEQREAAEAKRVAEWKQRKEIEIALTRENRIKCEVDSYHTATTLQGKRAVLESLSPEALARITDAEGLRDKVK